jgi:hypothetical protein
MEGLFAVSTAITRAKPVFAECILNKHGKDLCGVLSTKRGENGGNQTSRTGRDKVMWP